MREKKTVHTARQKCFHCKAFTLLLVRSVISGLLRWRTSHYVQTRATVISLPLPGDCPLQQSKAEILRQKDAREKMYNRHLECLDTHFRKLCRSIVGPPPGTAWTLEWHEILHQMECSGEHIYRQSQHQNMVAYLLS